MHMCVLREMPYAYDNIVSAKHVYTAIAIEQGRCLTCMCSYQCVCMHVVVSLFFICML